VKRNLLVLFICFLCFGFKGADYEFESLNGDTVTYEELTSESKNTILFLWTTWCGSCRKDLKAANASSETREDIKVYYVNLGETKGAVDKLSNRMNLKQAIKDDIILDKEGFLARKFHAMFVPTFIFFKDGEVIYQSNSVSDNLLVELYVNQESVEP